jgi:uncharacterized protein YecT (DUF1311 family)
VPSRFILLAALFGAVLTLHSHEANAQDDCDVTPDIAVAQCLGKRIDAREEELERLYKAALSRMPEQSPFDTRKSKAQLVHAQAAWKNFVTEHCAYVGGVEGGGNLWVTIFSEQCLLEEYAKRIAFFQHPPEGG